MANSNQPEKYSGTIDIAFNGLPSIKLVSILMEDEVNATTLQRLSVATLRRFFTLQSDWKATLDKIDYKAELNGEIIIPKKINDEIIEFDGASIPLPWLICFLTVGIIRPLGILLTASIIHDFAFRFGYILKSNGSKVYLERHETDKLFKDIVTTVHGLPSVGLVAWFFVRLGWFGIRYNGKRWTGRPPYLQSILFLIITLSLGVIFHLFPQPTVIALILLYLAFYILSIWTLNNNPGCKSPQIK